MSNFNHYQPQDYPIDYQNQYGSSALNQYTSQITSNIFRVVSLEDAIMRTPSRPCDMVYFNQDCDEFYRVKVDLYGKKSWATFPFTSPTQNHEMPVTRAEYDALVAKVNALSGGNNNGESNGQSTV